MKRRADAIADLVSFSYVATKSAQPEVAKVDVEELLEILEQTLDRTKVMYEQYFLGIQKVAPAQLHAETERRIRDLTQMNIRNTALRYRFATTQQKFGSYNAYWRRTLRQIEGGTYLRSLQKIGRNAARSGEEIPEEILSAMPKRMRDQVKRDRDMALANAARRGQRGEFATEEATQEDLMFDGEGASVDLADDGPAMISEPSELRRSLRKQHRGAHVIDESDSELDLDAFFAEVADAKPEPAPEFLPPETLSLAPVDEPPTAQRPTVSRVQASRTPPPQRTPPQRNTPLPMPAQAAPAEPFLTPQKVRTQPPPAEPFLTPEKVRTPPPVHQGLVPAPPPIRKTPHGMPAAQPPKTTALGMPATGRTPAPAIGPARLPNLPPITKPPGMPAVPDPPQRAQTTPAAGAIPVPARIAPSQITKPNPIAPGASNRPPVPVETMSGPFPREPKNRAVTAPGVTPAMRPPPGMTEQDVNTLYTKYIKAKEMVGEDAGPAARDKLMKTIHAQAPKIMEQYKAKGVDFSVVVKDNQVIIRAKPKT